MTKMIYENDICQVFVQLRQKDHSQFARAYVIAPDSSYAVWEKTVSGDRVEVEKSGHLWWKTETKTRTAKEELLEQAVIEALKYADCYEARYKSDVQAGEKVILGTECLVSALREVRSLTEGGSICHH